MSIRSKFEQFVHWVSTHQKKEFDDPLTDLGTQSGPTTWTEGETQAKYDELAAGGKYWIILGDWAAQYWDAKLRGGAPPTTKPPITGNADADGIIIAGGVLVVLGIIWSLFKRFILSSNVGTDR